MGLRGAARPLLHQCFHGAPSQAVAPDWRLSVYCGGKNGFAASSAALSGTASCASTRRTVVAKAETRWRGATAAARSWLRREVVPSIATRSAFPGQLSRTQSAKAAAKRPGLIRFIRMVSQRSPGDAVLVGQVPAQEGEIGRPPGGDILVIVAVGEVAANDQKLGSRERMKDSAEADAEAGTHGGRFRRTGRLHRHDDRSRTDDRQRRLLEAERRIGELEKMLEKSG